LGSTERRAKHFTRRVQRSVADHLHQGARSGTLHWSRAAPDRMLTRESCGGAGGEASSWGKSEDLDWGRPITEQPEIKQGHLTN
jgi:hypothetical protein